MTDIAMEFPKSRLLEAKQRRQDASRDALLLKNRIALLKAEEEKAWKIIKQTRRRAAELIKVRQDNDRDHMMFKELTKEMEQQTRASIEAKREFVCSIVSPSRKREISKQLIDANKKEARKLKEDKQRWKKSIDRQKLDDMKKVLCRKEEIARQKEALRVKKINHMRDLDKHNRIRVMEKVRVEEDQAQRHKTKVQEMERQELDLIQRLRNTQHLQKQAFQELEAALNKGLKHF